MKTYEELKRENEQLKHLLDFAMASTPARYTDMRDDKYDRIALYPDWVYYYQEFKEAGILLLDSSETSL